MKLRIELPGRLVGAFLALVASALPTGATWSIVAVDARTREVCVASATCLPGNSLQLSVPVVAVGFGAGAAQSLGDPTGVNRQIMFQGFQMGSTPREIFDEIRFNGAGSLANRQYGIVSFTGDPLSFSHADVGAAKDQLTGTVGDITYAIQGNVLTAGSILRFAAQDAFLDTDGDLSQRVMAAMVAAREKGGDGRCSCPQGPQPFSCGAPPPGFEKSAHVAFIVLARIGDTDGPCDNVVGCTSGEYYLDLDVVGGDGTPEDPVDILEKQYDVWRANLVGRPDHILSRARPRAGALPADGVTRTQYFVEVYDVYGNLARKGGADVVATPLNGLTTIVGPTTDYGNGVYSFDVQAGTLPGTESFEVTADDGVVKATLFPYPTLRLDAPIPLHVGQDEVEPYETTTVPVVLNVPEAGDGVYVLLASASGTSPGIPLGPGTVLPLNPGPVFRLMVKGAGKGVLRRTLGTFDPSGRAQIDLVLPAGLMAPLSGWRIDLAAVHVGRSAGVTNADGFDVGY